MPHRNAFIGLVSAGMLLGAGLSALVPTEVRTQPNSQLAQLSQVRVVAYPNADRAVAGPDSYPVEYSPQWLAVAEQAERQRMARWALPEAAQPVGYEQPSPERDLAVEREGSGEADVAAPPPETELAEAEAPAT